MSLNNCLFRKPGFWTAVAFQTGILFSKVLGVRRFTANFFCFFRLLNPIFIPLYFAENVPLLKKYRFSPKKPNVPGCSYNEKTMTSCQFKNFIAGKENAGNRLSSVFFTVLIRKHANPESFLYMKECRAIYRARIAQSSAEQKCISFKKALSAKQYHPQPNRFRSTNIVNITVFNIYACASTYQTPSFKIIYKKRAWVYRFP